MYKDFLVLGLEVLGVRMNSLISDMAEELERAGLLEWYFLWVQ